MCTFFQKPTKLLGHKYVLRCLVLATEEMELLGIFFGLVHEMKNY